MLFGAKVFIPRRQKKGMSLEWRPRESETKRSTEGQRAAVELGFQGDGGLNPEGLSVEELLEEIEEINKEDPIRKQIKAMKERETFRDYKREQEEISREAEATIKRLRGGAERPSRSIEGDIEAKIEVRAIMQGLVSKDHNTQKITKSEEEHLQHIINTMQEVLKVINKLQGQQDSVKVHAQLAKESGALRDLLDEHKESLRLIRSLENAVGNTVNAFRNKYGDEGIQRSRILNILNQELLQLLRDGKDFDTKIEELDNYIMRLGQLLTVYSTKHHEKSSEVPRVFTSIIDAIGGIINSTQECKQILETIKKELKVMRAQTDSL